MVPKDSILGKVEFSPHPLAGLHLPVASLKQDAQILTFMLFIGWVAEPDGDQDQEDK